LVDGVSLLATLDLHRQLGHVAFLFVDCVQKLVSRSHYNRILLKSWTFSRDEFVALEFHRLVQNYFSFSLNAAVSRLSISVSGRRPVGPLLATMAVAKRRLASLSQCFLECLVSAIVVRPLVVQVIAAHLVFSKVRLCIFLVLRSLLVTHFKKLRVFQLLILLYLWLQILLEDPVLKGQLIRQASRHQGPQVRSAVLWVFETTGVADFLQEAAHSFHQIIRVVRQLELQSLHDELLASFS
jgi:hypothetical protein